MLFFRKHSPLMELVSNEAPAQGTLRLGMGTYLNGLSIDVVVTLKCLYLLAFILSFVVMPKHVI